MNKALKMIDEDQWYVLVEDLRTNKQKFSLFFAKDEKEAKVKTYDKYGREIKILEITKNKFTK